MAPSSNTTCASAFVLVSLLMTVASARRLLQLAPTSTLPTSLAISYATATPFALSPGQQLSHTYAMDLNGAQSSSGACPFSGPAAVWRFTPTAAGMVSIVTSGDCAAADSMMTVMESGSTACKIYNDDGLPQYGSCSAVLDLAVAAGIEYTVRGTARVV